MDQTQFEQKRIMHSPDMNEILPISSYLMPIYTHTHQLVHNFESVLSLLSHTYY